MGIERSGVSFAIEVVEVSLERADFLLHAEQPVDRLADLLFVGTIAMCVPSAQKREQSEGCGTGAGADLARIRVPLMQVPMPVCLLLPRQPGQTQRHG